MHISQTEGAEERQIFVLFEINTTSLTFLNIKDSHIIQQSLISRKIQNIILKQKISRNSKIFENQKLNYKKFFSL